jgi:hypothetical protein
VRIENIYSEARGVSTVRIEGSLTVKIEGVYSED